MLPTEQFLRHAVECEEMARFTRDLESKATWRRMAERWRRCAEVSARESSVRRERPNERRRSPLQRQRSGNGSRLSESESLRARVPKARGHHSITIPVRGLASQPAPHAFSSRKKPQLRSRHDRVCPIVARGRTTSQKSTRRSYRLSCGSGHRESNRRWPAIRPHTSARCWPETQKPVTKFS
jgi:hypothetical protein